ncbi:MAG: hypothetical protein V3U76_03470 [Granulosicoccus sp.]
MIIDEYDKYLVLIELLSSSIEHWKNNNPEFESFNQRTTTGDPAVSTLRTLMDKLDTGGCGITSKDPCRRSKTPGIQQALSNAYLKTEGLYELRSGWIKLHHCN